MGKTRNRSRGKKNQGISLLFSIILVFCILGTVVYSVAKKISAEMSESAIQNLTASLDLIQGTMEAILDKEAEFQKLLAQEIASMDNPEEFVRSYKKNKTMVKMSLIFAGKSEGISNAGERFTEEDLDFSAGITADGVSISRSYLNYLGTWAYTMKCPVLKEGRGIATLYIEYVYDSFDEALPDELYNGKAMLYIMDSQTKRMVLKPKGIGERDAGHLNLEDFYRANNILEKDLQTEVSRCVENGENIMFYHDIRGRHSLNYMWSVNDGAVYLIGYVPIGEIQQEGRTVNNNIFFVVAVMLVAFILCCILYSLNQRQQVKARKEREREREVHNKQLAEALQAAQIASNSKTTFLSNMSHDIRTPMNAVLGFTTLLSKDAENPAKVREYTKKITASGQHLLSLINDILDVSKIESGKVVLTTEEFTLNDLVSSVDAIIRPMAEARDQEFHVAVTDIKHEYLLGDETRMNQILINLLSNAVKYTPEGGNIWFRIIGLKQRSSQYEHIRIEVEDDGYGMTPEYLETIFDAFTRAENSTTNKVQGTGLGMAITKNIVELMGGSIEVSSQVNQGSLFQVELEFRIPDSQAEKQFWKKRGIFRILAVDGDIEMCRTVQTLMKDTGVSVDMALTAEEALELFRKQSGMGQCYDIVLLEWNQPELDGMELARQIREACHDGDLISVIFLADKEEEQMQDELHRMGNAGMMMKPFFVSALKEKIIEMQTEQGEDEESETAGDDNLEGLRFLAAEDNEINGEILSEMLAAEGAGCEIMENGKLALDRFQNAAEGEFDAILMDVQMPVMNGYDATRAIRALEREDAGEIPIIAMTANAFAEDEREALAAGMNVHMAKPIDMEQLKKIIGQYVKRKE